MGGIAHQVPLRLMREWGYEFMRGLKDWRREDGQTMAEYGVILAVITPAIVAAIALLAFAIAGNLARSPICFISGLWYSGP